ncbi:MAG: fibronectin type III domain-containing protein [Acidobacteria bacterium]|nr:fibronectin type III domain-containing protein [Acidobacteriota bacterium]
MTRAWPLAALLLAAGCGTGTDGKPVARPTAPEPAPPPEPAPEAPGMPTGVRVLEVGETFILWTWDPVEEATGYRVDVGPAGTPAQEREPPVPIEEPPHRSDGLAPETSYRMWVQAVRETAGGRAVSDWTNYIAEDTWPDFWAACKDEQDQARERNTSPVLIDEWDGTPFPIYFDEAIPESERADAEHLFGVAERLADRIEDQIGYRIIELGGWLPVEKRTFEIRDADLRDCERVRPGEIIVTVIPEDRPDLRAAARPYCAAFFWDDNDLDATWDGVFSHELFHLFGFGHSLETHPQEAWQGGIPMSVRLTNARRFPRDLGVTFDDVDALRCIFPEGG